MILTIVIIITITAWRGPVVPGALRHRDYFVLYLSLWKLVVVDILLVGAGKGAGKC